MDGILHKIELFMFYNMVVDDHIIQDDGTYNVPMENHNNLRYTFIDDKDFGDRTGVEQKKIILLNDMMEIFSDLHTYIHENHPENKPSYFDKNALKSKIENKLDINTDSEPIDGESCEETDTNSDETITDITDQTINQITDEITDMEL